MLSDKLKHCAGRFRSLMNTNSKKVYKNKQHVSLQPVLEFKRNFYIFGEIIEVRLFIPTILSSTGRGREKEHKSLTLHCQAG